MSEQDAIDYVQSCGEQDGPETYDQAAEIFAALYGRAPDADDGDLGEVWSLCCAAVPATTNETEAAARVAGYEEIKPSSGSRIPKRRHATKLSTGTPYYHVYAPDGFESAHRSLGAAERAAKRGAKNRRLEYRVYLTSAYGMTGGGHGTLVYTALPPRRR